MWCQFHVYILHFLYARIRQSQNILVQYMAQRAMYNVLGTLGTNRVKLRHKFGVPRNKCIYPFVP